MLVRRVEKRPSGVLSTDQADGDEARETDHEEAFAATPGGLLNEARLTRGLTEAEVAERLHLSQRWVKDIEADEFSRAPALIYIRGYLRAYARLVGVSPLSVLTAFETMGWRESQAEDSQDWLRTMGQQSQRERLFRLYRKVAIGFGAIAAVVLLILFVLWWRMDEEALPMKWGTLKVKSAMQLHIAGAKVKHSTPVGSKPMRRVAT